MAEATPATPLTEFEIWLSADSAEISGGLGDETLVTATDATYPSGYVGFGARPNAYAIFEWVHMRGK
ncbi:MAG: hypothetical protein KAW89_08585 [Armatimonadetes bacterium]|nr:hypothetical protein [Armatimonadota bacterium]